MSDIPKFNVDVPMPAGTKEPREDYAAMQMMIKKLEWRIIRMTQAFRNIVEICDQVAPGMESPELNVIKDQARLMLLGTVQK